MSNHVLYPFIRLRLRCSRRFLSQTEAAGASAGATADSTRHIKRWITPPLVLPRGAKHFRDSVPEIAFAISRGEAKLEGYV